MKQKQHKSITTWNKALKSFDENLVKEGRLKLGIPKNGFKTQEEFETWDNNNQFYENRFNIQPKSGKGRVLLDTFENLVEVISKMSPYINNGFYFAIWEYIFYDEVSEKTLIKSNSSGCEVVFIDKSKENFIDDGVYIKIGPHTNISNVKNFLNNKNQCDLIRLFQRIYKIENNISKVKNVKTENFEMNNWVYEISILPIPFLQKFAKLKGLYPHGNPPKERDILGSTIMQLLGYEITDVNFKAISNREKKKRKVTQKRSKKV